MKYISRFKDIEVKNEQYTEKDFKGFKMRAETPDDVISFLSKAKYLISEYHVVTDLSSGGLTVEFKSREPLENLLDIIKQITDGHIMYRTLTHSIDYNGDDVRDNDYH